MKTEEEFKAEVKVLFDHFKSLPQDQLDAVRGNPQAVLKALSDYCDANGKFMNIGMKKGNLIADLIKQQQPKIAIELGGYLGFSALLFAPLIQDEGKYYSFEYHPEFAEVINWFCSLAGLGDKVEVITGFSNENLPEFSKKHGHDQVDFAFIDHWDKFYVQDLKIMEQQKLIKPGSLIVADNVGDNFQEAKKYLAYVKGDYEYKKQFEGGDPNLVYESKTSEGVEVFEGFIDNFEITKCVGYKG